MIFGKIIGALLGFFAGGIIGALIGIAAGHFFDKGIGQAMGFDYGANREQLQRLFFDASFSIMGHIAKSDGHISEEEIAQAEAAMVRLGLSEDHRKEAIALFKRGAEADFSLDLALETFVNGGGRTQNLPVLLLEFLFSMAFADGELHENEKMILSRTAQGLGINARQFERLLSMLTAQQQFKEGYHDFSQRQAPAQNELENAYKALGVNPEDSDREIKRAYRKLMSQHHPDKLSAQGIPDDMMAVATEKAQEIQVAYDLVKQSRKSN